MVQVRAASSNERAGEAEAQANHSSGLVAPQETSRHDTRPDSASAPLQGVCDQRRVEAQLIRQIYKQGPVGIIGTLGNASIVVFILWKLIPHGVLLTWLGTTGALAALRYGVICAHRKASFNKMPADWWKSLQVAGAGASGLLWGAAGIWLFPKESTAHQAFLAFVLAGMVAGAVGIWSPMFAVFLAFALPALAPIFIRFLLVGDDLHIAMGAMTLFFIILTCFTAKYINVSARELVALKVHFEDKVAERTAELTRANAVLNREIAERKQAEQGLRESETRIRSALSEKEVLLQEVHHRVKNNLAVITSLLGMQSSRIAEPRAREALQDCHDRVKAMALVHEILHQSKDLAGVPLESYARTLADSLMQMMLSAQGKATVRVVIEAEGVRLPIDQAMPCGLILNELLTNALKYAFPGRDEGRILISARLGDNGIFELLFRDNGVGLPADVLPERANTLGFRIISALVKHQMEGDWEAIGGNGACFRLWWPTPIRSEKRYEPGA